jgi:hypothetical protein
MVKKFTTNETGVVAPRVKSSAFLDSHYVKVMLDQIFGENNFVNEVVWN